MPDQTTTRFETGRTYYVPSLRDQTFQWRFTVTARTARTVTVVEDGEVAAHRRRVRVIDGIEQIDPLGRYSLAPILRADRVLDTDDDR